VGGRAGGPGRRAGSVRREVAARVARAEAAAAAAERSRGRARAWRLPGLPRQRGRRDGRARRGRGRPPRGGGARAGRDPGSGALTLGRDPAPGRTSFPRGGSVPGEGEGREGLRAAPSPVRPLLAVARLPQLRRAFLDGAGEVTLCPNPGTAALPTRGTLGHFCCPSPLSGDVSLLEEPLILVGGETETWVSEAPCTPAPDPWGGETRSVEASHAKSGHRTSHSRERPWRAPDGFGAQDEEKQSSPKPLPNFPTWPH
jgi:hypothetical protein